MGAFSGGRSVKASYAGVNQTCIFIDGENLRICLVEMDIIDNRVDYLPTSARWSDLFKFIAGRRNQSTIVGSLLRTYWYVAGNILYKPDLPKSIPPTYESLLSLMKDMKSNKKYLGKEEDIGKRYKYLKMKYRQLMKRKIRLRDRVDERREVEKHICERHDNIEFRRQGTIIVDLESDKLGKEKGVDVHLATDMVSMANIYDTAILISGDQDFLPAVQAVKNMGKNVTVAVFGENGTTTLRSVSRNLVLEADRRIILPKGQVKEILGLR